jgi:hypothetical protein
MRRPQRRLFGAPSHTTLLSFEAKSSRTRRRRATIFPLFVGNWDKDRTRKLEQNPISLHRILLRRRGFGILLS